MTPAGFWPRCAAWSIDAVIVAVPVWWLAWPHSQANMPAMELAFDQLTTQVSATMASALDSPDPQQRLLQLWLTDPALHAAVSQLEAALSQLLQPLIIGFVAIAAVYWVAFERSAWQATPGKCALQLVVTDEQGRRIGVLRAIARHAAGALSWLTLNLGHAVAAIPPQKRALHDHLAGTRVLGPRRLPPWAIGWLLLLGAIALIATAQLLTALSDAMQAAIDKVLLG